MKRQKQVKSLIEYILFRAAHGLLACLPYRWAEAALSGLLIFAGCGLGIRRKVAMENLGAVFPTLEDKQKSVIIRKMWSYLGKMTAEVYFSRDETIFPRIRTEGLEHLQAAHALGRGTLVVTAHYGNWELAGRYAAHLGFPCTILIKRQRNPRFDEFTNRLRVRRGIETIYKEKSFRYILSSLRKNRVVALAADQDARWDGILMDFLNRPASVHSGPAKIAIKTKSPIVGMYCIRQEDGTHLLRFLPPIMTDDIPDNDDGEFGLTTLYVRQMEEHILAHPEQWFWMHRRWKGADKARVIGISHDDARG